MADDIVVFDIDREQVARYYYWFWVVVLLISGPFTAGLGWLALAIYVIFIGPWLSRKQSEALRYWLEGTTLRIDEGVVFLKRKAIPLDRVTDVVLAQGPMLRMFGIWDMQVQTAGAVQQMAEGVLRGVRDEEHVRDLLLTARDEAVKGRASPAT